MFSRKAKSMPCEKNQEKISALLDAELPPAEKEMLEKHLSMCVKCRTLEEWLKCVKAGLGRAAKSLTISPGLREKILALLPDLPIQERRFPWWKRFVKNLYNNSH